MASEGRNESAPPKGQAPGQRRPGIMSGRRLQFRTLQARIIAGTAAAGLAITLGGALILGRAAFAVRDLERNQYAGLASETRMRLDRLVNRDRSRLIESAYSDGFYEQVGRGIAPPDSMIRPSFGDRFATQFGDRFIGVYDLSGKALYRWNDESLPNIEGLIATNALFRMLDNREPTIGLARSGNELYWIGGVPVLPTNFTDQTQPIRGYVVVAQRFNPGTITPGAGDRAGRLELTPLTSQKSPFQTRVDAAAGSRDSVRVTFSLADVFAQQTTLATLTTGRAGYRTVESTLWWLMFAAVLGAAAIAGALFVAARRIIVDPVSRLAAAMVPSQASPFPSLIGSVSTAKEWSRVTGAVNRLLTYTRGSQDRLDRLTGAVGEGAFERELSTGEWTLTPRFRQLLGATAPDWQPAQLSERLVPGPAAAELLAWLTAENPEPRAFTRDLALRAGGTLRIDAAVTTDTTGAPNRIVGRVVDLGTELGLKEAAARAAAERDGARAAHGRVLTAIAHTWPDQPGRQAEWLGSLRTVGAGLSGSIQSVSEPFDLYALLQELSGPDGGADLRIVPGVPERVEGDRRLVRSIIVTMFSATDRTSRPVLRADQPNRLDGDTIRISVEDRAVMSPGTLAAINQALATGDSDAEPLLEWRAIHFMVAALGGRAECVVENEAIIRTVTLRLREVATPAPAVQDTAEAGPDSILWETEGTGATFEPHRETERPSRAEPVIQLVADATVTIDLDREVTVPDEPVGAAFAAELAAGSEDAIRTARIALDEIPARLAQLRGGVRAGEARTAIETAVAIEHVAARLGATGLGRRCRDLIDAAEHSYLDTADQLLAALDEAWLRTAQALASARTADAPEPVPAIDPATVEQLTASLGEGGLGTQLVALFLMEAPERVEAIERAAEAGNLADLRARAEDLKGMCGLVGASPMARQCALAQAADGVEAAKAAAAALRTEWTRAHRALDQLTSARIGA